MAEVELLVEGGGVGALSPMFLECLNGISFSFLPLGVPQTSAVWFQ